MAALLGRATDVDVYEREEESKLAWKADHGDGGAWIEVEIAEKGWGTNVSVTAENGGEPTKLEGWLDAVLDELATPQKRPFEGMTETPADTLPEAASEVAEAASEEPPGGRRPRSRKLSWKRPRSRSLRSRSRRPSRSRPPRRGARSVAVSSASDREPSARTAKEAGVRALNQHKSLNSWGGLDTIISPVFHRAPSSATILNPIIF